MRFSLSEEQAAFRDAVRDLLTKECTPTVVRVAWDAPPGELDRGVWAALGEMGVLSLLVPAADGGLGLDETYLVPILEECGRVALPHPVVETAMVGAPLLGAAAGMVTTDLGGPHVPCAVDADTLLLHHDGQLLATAPGAVTLQPVATVDGARRAATVTDPQPAAPDSRHDSQPPQAGEVGGPRLVTHDPPVIELAIERGTLGTAAVLVGLGQAMLDMTVAYVRERQQFGVPVGSFQAVKHHLADAALALEFTRPAVMRAAWSLAHDAATRVRDVAMAKAMANDAASLVGRKALQCHGAIGYTVEADLHLFMKRSWALTRTWGDSAHHTRRVATALGL